MAQINYRRAAPDPLLEEFGAAMRKYRKRKGLDPGEVASKLGISTGSLLNWEAGLTSAPMVKALAWAEVLGVDLWPVPPGEMR